MKKLRLLFAGFAVASCACLPAQLFAQIGPGFAPPSVISSASGLTASVTTSGSYSILVSPQGWTFSGTVGPVQNLQVSVGTDAVGTWQQISFNHATGRLSSIRLYDGQATALFSTQYQQGGANASPFPSFDTSPQTVIGFNYNGLWSYRFGGLNTRAPWVFFDPHANTFILSPASNFMTAVGQFGANGALQM